MGSIEINIIGQRYIIKGDAPSEHIQRIAEFVDSRIKEIYAVAPNTPPLKAVILTALNIADELYKTKGEYATITERLEEKTEYMIGLFD